MGRNKNPKYSAAVDMYNKGMSIQQCAEYYSITRQAMHKILKRRNCQFRDKLKHKDENHFYRGGAEHRSKKKRAQRKVAKQIKNGTIINPMVCEECGSTGTFIDGRSKIQAHHDNYNKPLSIRWLCQKCHHKWHIHNKAIH